MKKLLDLPPNALLEARNLGHVEHPWLHLPSPWS